MSLAKDLVAISKPRIILLLLVVAWAAMFAASGGLPPAAEFWAVTVAGTASTAASGAINNVVEKDRDARMGRTADRPVASGRLPAATALTYGLVMAAVSVAALALVQAWLAAALTFAAIAYYVIVYTVWLKPTTPQNIVIGGFAGSFPALIGWAAVTGGIGAPAILMALLVFAWTPAHFWALALLYKDDYAAADYPMMPNVKGEAYTRRQIVAYSFLTLGISFGLVFTLDSFGILYLVAAALLGGLLCFRAVKLLTEHEPAKYRTFFLYTIQYLGFLLIAFMVDQSVPVLHL
ncbi:MAG: heme o synthase [Thermoplasmatota archaeon]